MITAASPHLASAQVGPPQLAPQPIGAGSRGDPTVETPANHTGQPSARPRIDFDPSVVEKNIREAIEHLNKQMVHSGRTLGFTMDDALSTPIVTVKNTQTGEVIRQIPSEAVVRVAHTLESLKGLLHDSTQ